MNRSWNQTLAIVVLAFAACAARAQVPPGTMLEASVETYGNEVHFPSSLAGQVIVLGCPGCVDQTLQLSADTRCFLNGREIAYTKLAAAALGAADKPLTIHYRLKDKIVTRVDLTSSES